MLRRPRVRTSTGWTAGFGAPTHGSSSCQLPVVASRAARGPVPCSALLDARAARCSTPSACSMIGASSSVCVIVVARPVSAFSSSLRRMTSSRSSRSRMTERRLSSST